MSEQDLINAAKASTIAYNTKNWDSFKAAVNPRLVYDEVGTGRRIEGSASVIEALQGWAKALPDSKATFESAFASGSTVALE